MKNRSSLSRAWLAVIAFAFAIPVVASAAERKTNVLVIIADDLNPSLGCYGNETVKTPNIDRLAGRGVMMTRAYSSWASCLPGYRSSADCSRHRRVRTIFRPARATAG